MFWGGGNARRASANRLNKASAENCFSIQLGISSPLLPFCPWASIHTHFIHSFSTYPVSSMFRGLTDKKSPGPTLWGSHLGGGQQRETSLGVGFPGGSAGKESACNAGDLGLIPGVGVGVGKIHCRRERLPTPVFWPGEFQGLYSPWGRKKSDTTEHLSRSRGRTATKGQCPGPGRENTRYTDGPPAQLGTGRLAGGADAAAGSGRMSRIHQEKNRQVEMFRRGTQKHHHYLLSCASCPLDYKR